MRPAGPATGALAVALAVLALVDAALRAWFVPGIRLPGHVGVAYLEREVRRAAAHPGGVIVLGDSVLWGMRLRPEQTAIGILDARGAGWTNLTIVGTTPAEDAVLARRLLRAGARPRIVIVDLSPVTMIDRPLLRPAFADIGAATLGAAERATLAEVDVHPDPVDDLARRAWFLYGVRSEIRQALFGGDAGHALARILRPWTTRRSAAREPFEVPPWIVRPAASALRADNPSLAIVTATLRDLHGAGIAVTVILTPRNPALTVPAERAAERRDARILTATCRAAGARVVDLQSSFTAGEFLDPLHLNAAGQARLVPMLADAAR